MAKIKDTLEETKAKRIEQAEMLRDEPQEGFYFDEARHAYFLDGRPLHGVTTILGVIAKPMLIGWAANMAVDFLETVYKTDGAISDIFFKEARTAHRRKKEDAGQKGTDVHSEVEKLVKGQIEGNNGAFRGDEKSEIPQVQLFINWAVKNNVRFLESEKRVFSRESWYAGTLDLVLQMGDKKWIADVKTSSAIYPEMYLQMAAYQGAMEEMDEHTDIGGAMVINLPKKGGFEIGENYDYEGNRLAFLAALTLFKQLNAIRK